MSEKENTDKKFGKCYCGNEGIKKVKLGDSLRDVCQKCYIDLIELHK